MIRSLSSRLRAASELLREFQNGRRFARSSRWNREFSSAPATADNDLLRYFQQYKEGPGIWKWNHYFDAYHAHLAKFRGRQVTIVEIGVYSGGSLNMWKHYFGSAAEIIGVDIEPACKSYEREGVKVFIGDQADRSFWVDFRRNVQNIDVVIDDGGHLTNQQIVTMEELLPHMNPGGVYICEDVHGSWNRFSHFFFGFASLLNGMDGHTGDLADPERRVVSPANPVQSLVNNLTLYPFLAVVELRQGRTNEFLCPKRGTEWEPFLS